MEKIQQLINKGVSLPDPQAVVVGETVQIDRIAGEGVVLYPGTRIEGSRTFIAAGARIGAEGPATVEDCYVGPEVQLKGGFFSGAVFLSRASCGLGAHIRQGTIMEEAASAAHTVGLKQTILFPFVTLGSLINFCDCLMAGGSGPDNHSEVGSSYIHFNFTPLQDKATPSLIGDVPKGVLLNQPPIFLGGQGGLVGPCRLAFGTVTAAGAICRHDQLAENHLVLGGKTRSGSVAYVPGTMFNLKRILTNNLIYIGNLFALAQWYSRVRALFVGPAMPLPLFEGLKVTVQGAIDERIRQLGRLGQKLTQREASGVSAERFAARWPLISEQLGQLREFEGEADAPERFLVVLDQQITQYGKDYLTVVKHLDPFQAALGTRWLSGIVQKVMDDIHLQ